MKFDDAGYEIPGSCAISTVRLGAYRGDGESVPFVTSAVCDVCGGWASTLWVSGQRTAKNDSMINAHESRRVVVQVYACPEHSKQVMDALVEEYGMAANTYEPDDLAEAVQRADRQH